LIAFKYDLDFEPVSQNLGRYSVGWRGIVWVLIPCDKLAVN